MNDDLPTAYIKALDVINTLSKENQKFRDALEIYADPASWSSEATFTYETGQVRADGYEEESTGHVELDGPVVWNNDGLGYELAQEALK